MKARKTAFQNLMERIDEKRQKIIILERKLKRKKFWAKIFFFLPESYFVQRIKDRLETQKRVLEYLKGQKDADCYHNLKERTEERMGLNVIKAKRNALRKFNQAKAEDKEEND